MLDFSHKLVDLMEREFAPAAAARPKGWFRSIQSRLIVLFSLSYAAILVLVEIVGFFGIPFTPYKGRSGYYKLEARRSLELIADLKEERLRWWIGERRDDVAIYARESKCVSGVRSLLDAIGDFRSQGLAGEPLWAAVRQQPDYRALRDRLREIRATFATYDRIFIVDAETAATVVSTSESDLGSEHRQEAFFTDALRSEDDYLSDVRLAEGGGGPVFFISRAVRLPQQKPLALMVAEVNTEEVIQPILHTGEGLGVHGEALLVNRRAQIITSLKHPLPDGSRPKPLRYQLKTVSATRAARGERGIVEIEDYRGEPVMAAYRFIQITPELGWGMVVKRDLKELLVPFRKAMATSFWLGVGGVLAVVGLTILVARGVARPLRALCETAGKVAAGDLDARAVATTGDEVGMLVETFNSMVAQIRKSQEALVRQERLAALGQLLATVSHEIRNPLGTIRTSFFVIAQRVREKGLGVEQALDRVDRSIKRCDAILTELLEYSRRRPLEETPTQLDSWLAALLGEQDIPKKIAVTRDLAAGVTLPLDRERVHRCMINVINNACQAMEPSGGNLTVASRVEDRRAVIRVTDTGCGIPPDQLEKVLEPLYSTKSFGVGLGLCIVKQILEQHGGGIHIESQPGQGTTVSLWLPIPENKET